MKHRIILLLIALMGSLSLFAQQQQEEKRSHSQLVFPEFQQAKVRQSFGRVTRAKCNIRVLGV